MNTQSLNGIWKRRIGMCEEHSQDVPYCTLPVGRSTCTREFEADKNSERVFLKFDGITYHAWITLNGNLR